MSDKKVDTDGSVGDEKAAKLREALGDVVKFDSGDVLRFKVTYPNAPTVYSFAAIYSGRRWFFTGARHNLPQGISTTALVRVLNGTETFADDAIIQDVELATAWAQV